VIGFARIPISRREFWRIPLHHPVRLHLPLAEAANLGYGKKLPLTILPSFQQNKTLK